MFNISELDIADLKVQMRTMYKHVGLNGSMRCLYEILKSAEILAEVIIEELHNDNV